MRKALLDRFLRYVRIDTQSKEDVEGRYPSTQKQLDLAKVLKRELEGLGCSDVMLDEHGIVYATLLSNLTKSEIVRVPAIGFLGHLDTSPEVSGVNVTPVLHRKYPGGDIKLPGDSSQVIRAADNPEMKKYIGDDIVTADGTTLLGADNKAGIAEILTALEHFNAHPEIRRPTLRIAFTPDEEVGGGTRHFDVKSFGADFAYTVDGEKAGEVENETFNAALAVFAVKGINLHPGYAKGKMVNAVRIVADLIRELASDPAPETTQKRMGYLHPYGVEGGVDRASLKVLIRDFGESGMNAKSKRLEAIRSKVSAMHPKGDIALEIKTQYQNMKVKLDEDPRTVEYALEAVKRAGLKPRLQIIRGGTDGAKLCFMGLLTPNIFTGGMNFHSKLEWIPVKAMELAVMTLVNLAQVWVEKSL